MGVERYLSSLLSFFPDIASRGGISFRVTNRDDDDDEDDEEVVGVVEEEEGGELTSDDKLHFWRERARSW
tara:strand:- start:256 stop:465 length:210 start_codon:yes stop_codon:yes gene_type:complete